MKMDLAYGTPGKVYELKEQFKIPIIEGENQVTNVM